MTVAKKNVLTYRAPSRLSKLVSRAGGIHRDAAISRATESLEALRADFMPVLVRLIGSLCSDVPGEAGDITARLGRIEDICNQIITISGTYRLDALEEAAMRTCDLAAAFAARNEIVPQALQIHLDALKLFCPSAGTMDGASSRLVLENLRKVVKHFSTSSQTGASKGMGAT